MSQEVSPSRHEPAALSVASSKFTYRFFLSVCLLLLVLGSQVLEHTSLGIFILVLMDLLFCADIIFRCALKDVWHGQFSLSALVSVCVLCGFSYSVLMSFHAPNWHGPVSDLYVYTMLLVTLTLWIERRLSREKERTRVFIKKLDDFLPKAARVCVGRQFRKVFARELQKGALVFVKVGERLPCDGIIRKGKTSIDEQLITGNMMPTAKRVDHHVYAGTLNKSDDIYVEATETLPGSAIMGIINAIKTSERHRAGARSLLDGYAAWVLPFIGVCALGLYVGLLIRHGVAQWYSYLGVFLFTAALFCPVAFAFSVVFPSFFARRGGARKKLKIQNLNALEKLVDAQTVFFDKTGTLTYGELRVSGVYPVREETKKPLLYAVITAEQLVDGPFADAVNTYAREHKLKPRKLLAFDVLPGLGVQAQSRGNRILAGSIPWLAEQGITVSQTITQQCEAVICVAVNGEYLGYLTLSDELRPGAAEMVDLLRAQRKEIILVSGDNESSVSAIAKEAGIEKYNFFVLPKTKAEIVGNLQGLGQQVAMVGDGFNDIIALLKADVGIVFSSGKNVYNNWVDVIIKRRDLKGIGYLFAIHTKLRRLVRQNVILCVLLNGLLAAGLVWQSATTPAGWQWPVLGALAVVVIVWLNSLRMLHIK